MFIKIVVSVVLDVGIGLGNLPTATKFLLLSYIPTQVIYGSKNELVAKLYIDPSMLDDIILGFKVKLNSLSPIVHLYCVSYKPKEDENLTSIFDPVTKSNISLLPIVLPP